MKDYVAKKNNCEIFLARTRQLDEYLKNGFNIYEITDEKTRQLIASPEKGYLTEKPVLEIPAIK